ncbi:MAG: hypothetical protein FJ308_20510 [Planctomycetes bacterium]|nr:hypothetical protein [Planctomycetota bacterium]
MTSAKAFYRELIALGVALSIDARGRLGFDAPKGVMTDELMVGMRSHREDLVAIVERIEERAAIIEHDAGIPRSDSERMARMEVTDDTPEPMPKGVICPWCQGRRLVDSSGGLKCWDCRRLAWVCVPGAIVRADAQEIDLSI